MANAQDEGSAVGPPPADPTGPGGPFELVPEEVFGVPVRVFAGAPASMRDILLTTGGYGDRDFLVYEDERYSFGRHLAIVTALAARLHNDYGIGKGDRVAIAMRNYPEWIFTFWATQALGAVSVPLNSWWTGPELRHALEDSEATAVFLDAERLVRLTGLLEGLPLSTVVVTRHDGVVPKGTIAWEEMAAQLDLEAELPPIDIGPDDDSTILYTSGTTGRHKGAVMTQRNHVTNYMNMAMLGSLGRRNGPTPCTLVTYPLFHISGLMIMYTYTAFGGKLNLQYRWDLEGALRIIERERVLALPAVPTVLRQLVESPLLAEHDLSSLVSVATGATPVPPDLIHAIEGVFGGRVTTTNGYGVTETTGGVAVISGDECLREPTSVGRPLAMVDVRVVDPETGRDVATGRVGEVWFRGPNVVRGYWNMPEETVRSFTDGWFHTGDLGHIEQDGQIFLVDRLKDVVIRGGENVYCAEVEAALFEHPAVADVAVIGVPHRLLGEEVAAVVRVEDDASVTTDELRAHVAERLAAFKVPTTVVLRTEPLPCTATGKVLKRELRQEMAGQAAEPLERSQLTQTDRSDR